MAEPPTIKRLRAVLSELSSVVSVKGTGKQKRMLLVVRRISNDICEELGEADQETLSEYFNQMGQVISWIGNGNLDSASPLIREWLLPRAEGIQFALDGPMQLCECENLAGDCDGTHQLSLFNEEMVPIPVGVDSRMPGDNPGSR